MSDFALSWDHPQVRELITPRVARGHRRRGRDNRSLRIS